jgi:hypothetical protein
MQACIGMSFWMTITSQQTGSGNVPPDGVAHHGHDGDLHGLSLRYRTRWRSNWFNV